MIKYSESKDNTFLIGAYRGDKPHLPWILGDSPQRYEKLYNVRFNQDIFTQRRGGVLAETVPDFILIYDTEEPQVGYHLFPCVKSAIKDEAEMAALKYPDPNGSYIVFTLGEEVISEPLDMDKVIDNTRHHIESQIPFAPVIIKGEELAKAVDYSTPTPTLAETRKGEVIRFIDLFAGIGGIRCGLEQAIYEKGMSPVCVLTSEIKPYAVNVLKDNHPGETISGDITQVQSKNIPDFDILCAGFPCQAFSAAGKRQGFADTRGTLFFEVERILRDKRPRGFILENVEGLVNHDNGKTLKVIIDKLNDLNYKFDFRVLNAKNFGVPQERKRIYIVGSLNEKPNLEGFPVIESKLGDILESGLPTSDTPFIRTLLDHFSIEDLYGKSIKDKRGGTTNIHSWDLEIKGEVTPRQKELLDTIMTERRKKKWADIIGIDWMDGMPLTLNQIQTFFNEENLEEMLEDLTQKGYLKFEHPKKLIRDINSDGVATTRREQDITKPKGYNIVAGKLSFEINKVMSPEEIAPTLVAMDMQKLYVADNGGLRRLSLREGLRLCGYPDDIKFNVSEKDGFDLLGNTVVVPVIKAVAGRLLEAMNINKNDL